VSKQKTKGNFMLESWQGVNGKKKVENPWTRVWGVMSRAQPMHRHANIYWAIWWCILSAKFRRCIKWD